MTSTTNAARTPAKVCGLPDDADGCSLPVASPQTAGARPSTVSEGAPVFSPSDLSEFRHVVALIVTGREAEAGAIEQSWARAAGAGE